MEVDLHLERMNLRERLPELAATVVANMTSPILKAVAAQLTAAPEALICSGLLLGEQDEAAAAFEEAGLVEADHRQDGDWAALFLRRG
jgi:ribosomal protein L11 methyltransferase